MNVQTPIAKWVLLRHLQPDGGWHFDWLIERPLLPAARLLSFRVTQRPDLAPGPLEAEQTPDHRREYLTFEGELTGGRGSVTRVAEGAVEGVTESERAIRIEMALPRRAWHGTALGDGRWVFTSA